ncbi:MAG TPA: hypothetical protein VFE03_04225 [Caulobacteraceae bacterium]|jgi:hypothetical protein|nr:hypothetical protein [Caulobacteraceae bacterium]
MSTHALKASAFALIVATAGLAACDQAPFKRAHAPPAAALPLTDIATGPLPTAPPAEALPAAPRPRIARLREPRTHYAYLDRGYELSDVFYDAPPDYAFAYGGVEPWVWTTDDGYYLVAEPLDEGWRYYYYEPDVYYPFLVLDPFYAYGFDRGALVVVYDRGGRVLDPVYVDRQADIAGRYLVRAETLFRAAQTQPHEAVARTHWVAQQPVLTAERTRLAALQTAVPEWRAYHQARAAQDDAHWAQERARRAEWAAQTNARLNRPLAAAKDRRIAEQARQDLTRQGVQGQVAAPDHKGPLPVVQDRAQRHLEEHVLAKPDHEAALSARADAQQREQSLRAQQQLASRNAQRIERQNRQAELRTRQEVQQRERLATRNAQRIEGQARQAAAQDSAREARLKVRAQSQAQAHSEALAHVQAARAREAVQKAQAQSEALAHRQAQAARPAEQRGEPASARVQAQQQPDQQEKQKGKRAD